MNQKIDKKAARWTGFSLIIMAIAAGFAYGAIHSQLFIAGDMELTKQAVQAHPPLLIIEILLWLVILITDIIVSIQLYRFFDASEKALNISTALLRLIYSAVLASAIIFLIKSLSPESAYNNMLIFSRLWSMGLIVFGVHLTFLALLAFKSGFVPVPLSILLVIAGPAYTIIHLLYNFGLEFEKTAVTLEKYLSLPMALAEITLALWLIIVSYSGRKASF